MLDLKISPPPSTNNLFRNLPGRGRVRSDKYKAWQKEAGWEIKDQLAAVARQSRWPDAIGGPFALTIWLPPGIDLDNCKAVADLLGPSKHGLGITEDDRQMVELHVYRDREAKQCRVRIETRQ